MTYHTNATYPIGRLNGNLTHLATDGANHIFEDARHYYFTHAESGNRQMQIVHAILPKDTQKKGNALDDMVSFEGLFDKLG